MAMPTQRQVSRVLLLILHLSADGMEPADAVERVAYAFPQLTEADREELNASGGNRWNNYVHWARHYLVSEGLLDSTRYGWWSLTAEGHEEASRIFP